MIKLCGRPGCNEQILESEELCSRHKEVLMGLRFGTSVGHMLDAAAYCMFGAEVKIGEQPDYNWPSSGVLVDDEEIIDIDARYGVING